MDKYHSAMLISTIKILFIVSLAIFIINPDFLYPQENYDVTSVSFEGNTTLNTKVLENTVTLSSTGWFSKNILGDDPFLFNPEILNTDLANVVKLYQQEGFLFVKVKADKITNDKNKEIDVIFKIDEGPPVTVDKVEIHQKDTTDIPGVKVDSLISGAYNNLILTRGKRFRDEDIRKDEIQIIKQFIDNGYPHIKLNIELTVDTNNCLVSIEWNINPGVLSTFGKTLISGLNYYPENFIKNKLDYSQGEIFDAEKLDKNQKRLSDLGIFYSVIFNSMLKTDPPEIIPVKLRLNEAKRLRTTLGAGYGKDEKFRGSLEFTMLGLFKGPGRINFEAKKSAIEKFRFILSYTHPEFLWERASFRLNTSVAEVNEIPYNENSKGIDIGISGDISEKIFLSVVYSLENINLDITSIAIQTESSQLHDNYNKSGINLLIEYIDAEPYDSPETGLNLSLSNLYSGIGMNSTYSFFKSIIDFRNFNPIYSSLILAVKLSAGNLISFDKNEFIPVEERFYLGGSSSVRGWERFGLGPSDLNNKPIGGSSFLQGSAEFRYPALEKIYGVLFLDFGNVWERQLTYRINELQYAAGAGIRYATPIGPLRLDLAKPIFNTKSKIQFWFSIGHAF